jgi:hypothetical protein
MMVLAGLLRSCDGSRADGFEQGIANPIERFRQIGFTGDQPGCPFPFGEVIPEITMAGDGLLTNPLPGDIRQFLGSFGGDNAADRDRNFSTQVEQLGLTDHDQFGFDSQPFEQRFSKQLSIDKRLQGWPVQDFLCAVGADGSRALELEWTPLPIGYQQPPHVAQLGLDNLKKPQMESVTLGTTCHSSSLMLQIPEFSHLLNMAETSRCAARTPFRPLSLTINRFAKRGT